MSQDSRLDSLEMMMTMVKSDIQDLANVESALISEILKVDRKIAESNARFSQQLGNQLDPNFYQNPANAIGGECAPCGDWWNTFRKGNEQAHSIKNIITLSGESKFTSELEALDVCEDAGSGVIGRRRLLQDITACAKCDEYLWFEKSDFGITMSGPFRPVNWFMPKYDYGQGTTNSGCPTGDWQLVNMLLCGSPMYWYWDDCGVFQSRGGSSHEQSFGALAKANTDAAWATFRNNQFSDYTVDMPGGFCTNDLTEEQCFSASLHKGMAFRRLSYDLEPRFQQSMGDYAILRTHPGCFIHYGTMWFNDLAATTPNVTNKPGCTTFTPGQDNAPGFDLGNTCFEPVCGL